MQGGIGFLDGREHIVDDLGGSDFAARKFGAQGGDGLGGK